MSLREETVEQRRHLDCVFCNPMYRYVATRAKVRRRCSDMHAANSYPKTNTHKECIRTGILADYLKKKGSEVLNMLIAEYDYDMDIEVQREEAYTDGYSKGKTTEEIANALDVSLEEIEEIIYFLDQECPK